MALFDPSFDFNYSAVDFDLENRARAAAARAYDEAVSRSSSSSKKSSSVAKADTSDIDKQIKLLKDAMKEASGFKREELKARLKEAEADREARIEAARIGADASRYSADRSLEGTKYSSDAGERNSMRSLEGTKYSADSSAAASRYGTDADLYKFRAEQPTKRAEQALSFLKTYTDLSSRPDSFLQASNYARLGRQVEGMPGMMSDLLGNVNPAGAPQGGNIAFRAGTFDQPVTAGRAIFGDTPLNLGTRPEEAPLPTWMGPQGGGASGLMSPAFAGVGSYGASYGAGDHRGKLVSDAYGAQGGLPLAAPQAQRAVATDASEPSYAYPVTQGAQPYAINDLGQPRILSDGRVVADVDAAEEAFKLGARELMRRGAHQWGNQALERMTETERGLLASAIKDAGGVPQDYFEAYARSRIGNEGAGRAL